MARKPNIIPSSKLTIALPLPERTRLDLYLYSEVEGRVPMSSHKEFFSERIREFFDTKVLDLAPYLGCQPGTMTIRGSHEAIEALKLKLQSCTY